MISFYHLLIFVAELRSFLIPKLLGYLVLEETGR
jgi:hypothetical protein